MKKYSNLNEVWQAMDKGLIIYWHNTSYQLTKEIDPVPEKRLYSQRDGFNLRVTCLSNWFGSRLTPECINDLYSK